MILMLNLLLTLPQFVIFAYVIEHMVRLRRPNLYCLLTVVSSMAMYLLIQKSTGPQQILASICSAALLVLLPMCFTREKRRAVICSVTFLCAALAMEAIFTAVCYHLMPFDRVTDIFLHSMPALVMLKLLFLLLLCLLYYWIYPRLNKYLYGEWATEEVIPLLLVPVSQVLLLLILLFVTQSIHKFPGGAVLIGIAAACSIVADAVFFAAMRKVQKQQILHEQLRLTERQLNTQLAYYQKMNNNIALVNSIRHDLNNQLQVVYTLLENDEANVARKQLDVIRNDLHLQIGTAYCDNLVVDAVLVEASVRCNKDGIQLDADVQLPREIPIEGAYLCSALSNILDNAIKACQASNLSRPEIELKALLRAGCLTIRCRNSAPAKEPPRQSVPPDKLPDHGLGLDILRRLAEVYQGELLTRREEDGSFLTLLVLPLPGETLGTENQ